MKKALGEFLGTSILATVVVGSGAMAQNLSTDVGVQLLINALATGAALWLLITLFAPISGAHFNPVVSGIALFRKEISVKGAVQFVGAQITGAIFGTILANILFDRSAIDISSKNRDGGNLLLSEVLATAGLIFVIYQLSTIKKGRYVAPGVAAWIFAAYFFTSSTSFANPAIAICRIFSNTFAGIAPHSAFTFIPFQVLGAVIGYALFNYFNKKEKKK
ncbi:GlpF Glycerol uptake facilitator and related permeases (Major Intrinsic Protein Family) [Candidatus Nanopelagicaceae bacterium]